MPPLTQGSVLDVEEATGSLVSAFRAAEDELRAELERVVEIVALDPTSSKRYREEQVRGLLGRVATIRADLTGQASLFAAEGLGRVYAEGIRSADAMLGVGGSATFTTLHREALDVLAVDTFDDLAAATDYLEPATKRAIREATKARTMIGSATGASVRRDTNALVRALTDRGVTGFVDAAGRGWRISTYAEMVVRTKSAHAYNTGRVLRAEETGTRVFEIYDGERSGHEACLAYNRDTCSGAWALVNPVAHPNCVRSFGPLPLHRGGVDHGSLDDSAAVGVLEEAAGRGESDLVVPDPDLDPSPPFSSVRVQDLEGNDYTLPQGFVDDAGAVLDDLNREYGGLVDRIVVTDTTGYANAGGTRQINLNPNTILDDEFRRNRAREMRGMSVGDGSARDTLIHEYGHVVDHTLRDRLPDAEYRALIDDLVPEVIRTQQGMVGPDVFAVTPSPYAGESMFEWMAETFAVAHRLDHGIPVDVPDGAKDNARKLLAAIRSTIGGPE